MDNETFTQPHGIDDVEIQEWLESLDAVLESSGAEVATEILERLRAHATVNGIDLPFTANTPYANTIPHRLEPRFPGDQELERRIKSLIRWNALAMVVRANRVEHNIGGHISTFASARDSLRSRPESFLPRPHRRISKATPFISRATPLPACMRALFWKADSPRSSSKIFAAN